MITRINAIHGSAIKMYMNSLIHLSQGKLQQKMLATYNTPVLAGSYSHFKGVKSGRQLVQSFGSSLGDAEHARKETKEAFKKQKFTHTGKYMIVVAFMGY